MNAKYTKHIIFIDIIYAVIILSSLMAVIILIRPSDCSSFYTEMNAFSANQTNIKGPLINKFDFLANDLCNLLYNRETSYVSIQIKYLHYSNVTRTPEKPVPLILFSLIMISMIFIFLKIQIYCLPPKQYEVEVT